MKIIYLLFVIPNIAIASPEWFLSLPKGGDEIIGYGMSGTIVNAKHNALSSISESISVQVKSSTRITKSINNDKYYNSSSIKLNTESEAVLSNVTYLKIEKHEGFWYVAAKYDNATLGAKLKRLLPTSINNESQNNYLKNTPLIKELNDEIDKKLNYTILRKNNLWYLRYHEIMLLLSSNEFSKLFSNQENESIKIVTNKKVFTENDRINFEVRLNSPGYISILNIDSRGKVGVILSNHRSKESFLFPGKNNEDVLIVVNPERKSLKELYIAIHSRRSVNLSEFETINEEMLDDSNYGFSRLVSMLNSLDFSSVTIKIK